VIQERLEGWKGALDRVTATVEKSLAVSSAFFSSNSRLDGLLVVVDQLLGAEPSTPRTTLGSSVVVVVASDSGAVGRVEGSAGPRDGHGREELGG
jgi:hypothetical protein